MKLVNWVEKSKFKVSVRSNLYPQTSEKSYLVTENNRPSQIACMVHVYDCACSVHADGIASAHVFVQSTQYWLKTQLRTIYCLPTQTIMP